MNQGVIYEGIIPQAVMAGGVGNDLPILLPSGDWEPYLPSFEAQSKMGLETMNCVQFSRLNVCEIQANYYGKPINKSDRFLYWSCGCSERGNTFGACDYGLRQKGAPDESKWPWNKQIDRSEYGQEPPDGVKQEALGLLSEWDMGSLRYIPSNIESFKEALKKGPIWFCNEGHAMAMYRVDDRIRAYDTYGNGKGSFPLEYASQIVAAYLAPFTPKNLVPNPMPRLNIPENTLVTGVFPHELKRSILVNGKLMTGPVQEVLAAWFERNTDPVSHKFTGGETRQISQADWEKFEVVNFKGEKI